MKEYNTSTIAKEFNIHPNTVRFYEEIVFLLQIPRKENGYRLYNDEDIISACDKLLLSLKNAEIACIKMMKQIEKMKKINPPV